MYKDTDFREAIKILMKSKNTFLNVISLKRDMFSLDKIVVFKELTHTGMKKNGDHLKIQLNVD